MAGGRSTRRKSKATSTTAKPKRSLESTSDNVETKKGKFSGASVKGKKLKLQEEEEKAEQPQDNSKVDSNIHEDSQESKYVPPFSRSAKTLTEKQCAGNTVRKSKPRRGREKKSHKLKTGKNQKVSTGYAVGKEPLSLQQVRNAETNEAKSEGLRKEVVEERTSDLEAGSQELIVVGVKECTGRLLELLACEQREDAESRMDVGSEHRDPNEVMVKDGLKPAAGLAAENTECSLGEEERKDMEICAEDGGTSAKKTLELVVGSESGISLIISDVVLGDAIHAFVKPHSVAVESPLEVEKHKTLIAGNDEEKNANAEPDSVEKHAGDYLQVEGNTEEFTEGLELVSKHCVNKNNSSSERSDNNNGHSNVSGYGSIGNINKNNTDVHSNDIDNNKHTNSSDSKDDQTDNSKTSNFNNNSNNSDKDRKINNNENNNKYHGNKHKNNTNISEVENAESFLETDLREDGAGADQEIGEELYTRKGFGVNMVDTKKAATTVLDQQVPMFVPVQVKEEMRGEDSTSMLTVKSQYLVSGKEVKDSSDMEAMASCHYALPTENNILSQLSRNETEYLKQDCSASSKAQNTGPENCLSEVDSKDVIPEERCVENGQKQASMLGVVHTVKHVQSGIFHSAALKSLDMKGKELNCGANQEQSVTAVDQQTLSCTDSISGKVNSLPENHCSSTAQLEKMEHEKEPSDVAQQMSNNKSVTTDVDTNEEKGNVECLLDVDCEMDCTDSQLVHFDEVSLEAIVDATKEKPQTSMFAESDEGPGNRGTPDLAADVSRTTEDETMAMCDMIKGLTRELSALNQYLMGAWKEVEAIKKQRQARLKANKTKRAKQ